MKEIVYRIYVIVQHKLLLDLQVFLAPFPLNPSIICWPDKILCFQLKLYEVTVRMQRREIGDAEGNLGNAFMKGWFFGDSFPKIRRWIGHCTQFECLHSVQCNYQSVLHAFVNAQMVAPNMDTIF